METRKNIMREENDANVSQQLISKYLPYWPLLMLFSLLALAGAYVYLRYATPIYEASATLIIKDESRGGNQDSRVTEALDLISSKKNMENEIEVLQSRGLMEKVVKGLFLYAQVTQEGKIKSGNAYTLSPIMIEAQYPDSIQGGEKVNFNFDKASQLVIINGKDKYPLNQFVNTPYGSLKFIANKYYSGADDSKKQLYFSLENPQNAAGAFLGGLKLITNKQSAIVDITYRDPIPQRAVDIITQLIALYDKVSIDEKNALALNTLNFVNEQLYGVSHDLDSIEKKVQQYRSGTGAVDIGTQGTLLLQNMSQNDQKLGSVNIQLSVLNQLEKSVQDKASGQMMAPSTLGISDPSLTTLLTQLQNKELEYENLKKTVGENNPALTAIGDQIIKLRPSVIENIRNLRENLNASKSSLNITNSGFNSMLSTVPQKEKQLLEISREQQTKNNLFQFLKQKQQETQLSLAAVTTNSRLIDRPHLGPGPVSPKKMMVYMIAVVAALGVGIGIITIKDSFSGKIKYRNEIEKMTSIPIIGEIAFENSKSPLVIEKGTRSFVAEEFRKLRISLSFLGIDASHKKILLTSSISGEGKSFIAANLAVSLSLTGKKVALIDLDLNNPSLSKILDVDYEAGVTEYLTGEKTAQEVINKLENHDGLYFISAGSLPENPTELLANGKVEKLIDYLESNFDMVVIDTSPAVLVTDAYILSGMCDATLYIIRHDYTPKLLVKRIDETNEINPINNPAIVFNGVKKRGFFKNNYGYGYDYVYGNKERGRKVKKVS